jgi:hypothetical protein
LEHSLFGAASDLAAGGDVSGKPLLRSSGLRADAGDACSVRARHAGLVSARHSAITHALVRDRPAPPFCSSAQKLEPSNCCSRKRTTEPSITSATNSMTILRGAPVWRGAKDGQELLQCDGSAAVLR